MNALQDTPATVGSIGAQAVGSLPLDLIMWGLFGIVLIIYAIYSLIMLWHWKEYSTGKYTTVANMFMYVGVSVGFLAMMALAATWYSVV